MPGSRAFWRDASIVTALTAIYVLLALRLQSLWWFEDDPYQIAYAARHQPWEFFLSREGLSKGLVGLQFTPIQNLSYWVDGQLARESAGFAYAHTAVSLWVAMHLWFAVLRRWIGRGAALTVVVLTPFALVLVLFVSRRRWAGRLGARGSRRRCCRLRALAAVHTVA